MAEATIVFTDIVGFSRKKTPEQLRLVESLTEEVRHHLGVTIGRPGDGDPPPPILLPTGDGMAIAFFQGGNNPTGRDDLFSLLYNLQTWAWRETADEEEVCLRIGVHYSDVEPFTDINGARNICGDAANRSQRIMDAANARQVLFSEEAFTQYVGDESSEHSLPPFSPECSVQFSRQLEILVKHRGRLLVRKMMLRPASDWWCNDDPPVKDEMIISLTPLPKTVDDSFVERMGKAADIALIPLTGKDLVDRLGDAGVLSPYLRRLWVFLPGPNAYAKGYLTPPRPTRRELSAFIRRWRSVLRGIRRCFPEADIRLGVSAAPPYFGASFLDWEARGGQIHVSPYIWDVPVPKCPGYELEWLGNEPPSVYAAYVDGLRNLQAEAGNVLE